MVLFGQSIAEVEEVIGYAVDFWEQQGDTVT